MRSALMMLSGLVARALHREGCFSLVLWGPLLTGIALTTVFDCAGIVVVCGCLWMTLIKFLGPAEPVRRAPAAAPV